MNYIYPNLDKQILTWLNNLGFDGNPFKFGDAEREDFLRATFWDAKMQTGHSWLEWIYGNPKKPNPTIFFAGRGCGKTAHRLMLEKECLPLNTASSVLAVNFDISLWKKWGGNPSPANQKEEIIRLIIPELLNSIVAIDIDRLIDVDFMEFADLISIVCQSFCVEYLSSPILLQYLLQIARKIDVSLSYRSLKDNLKAKSLVQYLESQDNIDKRLIAFGLLGDNRLQSGELRYEKAMELLIKATDIIGIKAIYMLIDAVDEVYLGKYHWMDYLLPQLFDTTHDKYALKCFLPAEIKEQLLSRDEFRGDKFPKEYRREFIWTENDLLAMLANRLEAFHRRGENSIKVLCKEELKNSIEDKLISFSAGNPRNMMLLGRRMLAIHCVESSNLNKLISLETWKKTVNQVFQSKDYLRITPLLTIGSTDTKLGKIFLKLTQNEMSFLTCLVENKGVASKDELIAHIYDDIDSGFSDDRLTNIVSRLRKKIKQNLEKEYSSSTVNLEYIITKHGFGYELDLWQKTDEF
jgi:DNA-binding response OmpR family regulator